MRLNNCVLGDHIELRGIRNADLEYGVEDVRGVNNRKELMPTKADISDRDLSKFQVVYPGEFVFNHRTSRNGGKFSIAFNDGEKPIICTEDYVVFRIKANSLAYLQSEWLYMYFNRPEFDRYVITNSWGSSTEFYNWEDICAIKMIIPPLSIQKKYVEVYKSLLLNQKKYEDGLDDLGLTFEALVDEQKYMPHKKTIQELLEEIDYRNVDGAITEVQGINITKRFMPSVANTYNVNLKNYKIVEKGQFAFSGMQTGRDRCIRIALYTDEEPIIISPAYSVLKMRDVNVLPEYIMIWFTRQETDRLGWFMSDSSIRTNLDMDRFYEIKIPIPDLSVQSAIVEIYEAYKSRRSIAEQLKSQIIDICPILIKGSLDEAKMEA